MTLSLAFDIAFAVLLMVTIGYAISLNRKLGNLRKHKEELERLALTFSQSTARADDSIQRLKISTDVMQKGIEKGQNLRDDLKFLIDRGTLAADRLEDGVRGSRNKSDSLEPQNVNVPEQHDVNGAERYNINGPERHNIKRPVEPVETISDVIAARRDKKDAAASFFEQAQAATQDDLDDDKSKAERDLIEALRQVR